MHEAIFSGTHREQHDGDSQRDGGEDSQAHEQQQGVKLVDLGESVQQLRLHVACARRGMERRNMVKLQQNVSFYEAQERRSDKENVVMQK